MNKVINHYLTAAEGLLVCAGLLAFCVGASAADAEHVALSTALQVMLWGAAAMGGGLVCQGLKKLPRR